jgi:hypothetical protein
MLEASTLLNPGLVYFMAVLALNTLFAVKFYAFASGNPWRAG